MNERTVHADAQAALTRLQEQHSDLKDAIKGSYGYAVFPSVGRASLVLGGAYGHGEVYEQGKPIGFATLSQITIGVQVGGQTFSELLLFPRKEALDEFKTGKVVLTLNASAGIVKAAATGTGDFDTVTAHAYSRGGMILELSLGGQKFSFVPPRRLDEEAAAAGEQRPEQEEQPREEEQREAKEAGEKQAPRGEEKPQEEQREAKEAGEEEAPRGEEAPHEEEQREAKEAGEEGAPRGEEAPEQEQREAKEAGEEEEPRGEEQPREEPKPEEEHQPASV